MILNDITNSSEFTSTSRNIADSGVKLFFKHIGTVVSFLINFIKEMVRNVMGR